jgi:hypothetical protein
MPKILIFHPVMPTEIFDYLSILLHVVSIHNIIQYSIPTYSYYTTPRVRTRVTLSKLLVVIILETMRRPKFNRARIQ